jgi:hypothetical protein
MLLIDPMHNLFLGSGKHMLSLWLQRGILTPRHYNEIQQRVNSVTVPTDVGRIPQKITSGFSGFTADQFKNWITIYSIPALHGILPEAHFQCWRHFVLACRILCKRSLSSSDIQLSDSLLLHFCKKVEELFGKSAVTPNMHLHCHLKEVLLDYGPVYAFWLFSYERYNGILGSQPNNNKSIEPQLMNRFLKDNIGQSFNFPKEYSQEFGPLIQSLGEDNSVGSFRDTLTEVGGLEISLPSSHTRIVLDETERDSVLSLYKKVNPSCKDSSLTVNVICEKYSSVCVRGKRYGCYGKRGSVYTALAEWNIDLFGNPPSPLPDSDHPSSKFRPVKLLYYIQASISSRSGEDVSKFLVAVVSWCMPHPNKGAIGNPAQIWSKDLYEVDGIHTFLPLSDLKCRCASYVTKINTESVFVIVPLVE